MATDIVGSLFGVNPQAYQQAQQNRAYNQDYQAVQLDPLQQANLALRQGGRGLGQVAGGLLGMEDPELVKASKIKQVASKIDFTTPDGLRQLAMAIKDFAPQEAAMAAAEADKRGLTQAQTTKALREKDAPSSDLGKKIAERQAIVDQYGPNDPRVALYDKAIARSGEGQKIVVGVNAIDKEGNLRSSFLTEAKPYRDPFIAAGKIENLLMSESSLADKISKKQWGKLAGDATISNKDTEGLTQFGDLGTRLNGILSQFAEGKYSDDQRKEAINLARQIRTQSESGYNDVRGQYLSRAEAEKLDPKTLGYIAPALPKTSRSFVVGKIYKDKNGQQGVFEGYNTDGTPKFKPAGK